MQLARWGISVYGAICAAALLAACAGSPGGGGSGAGLEIKVLSNRADLVSGGDALVEVVLPKAAAPEGLRVDVDGRDVSSSFKQRADSRVVGLVTGLKDGANVVTARVGRRRRATDDHESSDRRTDLLRDAGAALGLRNADGAGSNGHRTGNDRERPEHRGHRCSVQHRQRGSSVLSHDRAVLAAQQRPAVLQAVRPERSTAGRSGGDDERSGREGEVHRARRARRDEPRDLRSRRALRSGAARDR